jgi:hypothetical protein
MGLAVSHGIEVTARRGGGRIGRLHAARKRERGKHTAYWGANASHRGTHGEILDSD